MEGISIAGRKRNDGVDLYETPKWATEQLLKVEEFVGLILEPACGLGAISDVIKEQLQTRVVSRDLIDYGYGRTCDFLSDWEHFYEIDNIITNPPYVLAEQFIQKSKLIANNKIAMILKLSFLESEGRRELFADTNFPLRTVYVFRKRVQMYPHGINRPKNSGTIAYAWFVWDKHYQGKTMVEWI